MGPANDMSSPRQKFSPAHVVSPHPDGTLIVYEPVHSILPCIPCRGEELMRRIVAQTPPEEVSSDLNTELSGKKVLVIANPRAGTGSAKVHARKTRDLITILTEAGLQVVIRRTERANHATELVRQELEATDADYSAVIPLGGDGTLHEVIMGLLSTKTPKSPNLLPAIGVAPGGTGNAIAFSLNLRTAMHAALNVVHGLRSDAALPVAVLRYRRLRDATEGLRDGTVDNGRFLIGGVQWGLLAEVDQGTEYLRMLGDARFTLGTLGHIARRHDYDGRIVICVDGDKQRETDRQVNKCRGESENSALLPEICVQTGENEYTLDGRFVLVVAWNCSAIAKDTILTPLARLMDKRVFDVLIVPSNDMTRIRMINFFLHADGSFLSSSNHYLYFKATQMIFERVEGNFLTVDGESVPVEPFVLEVAPETGSVRMFDSFSSS